MNAEFQRIRKHLARKDAVMKRLIKTVGPCSLQFDSDHFGVLVRSITAQQISTAAARTIHGRLSTALGGRIAPRTVLKASEESLRAAGLSQAKTRSLYDLAEKCVSGTVPLKKLHSMEDEAVIDALIPVRGIGRWTAEMFLIFSLGRLDVLPVADLGLRAGIRREHELAALPDQETLAKLTAPWQPYRSIGTWYIWRSFGNVPQS